MSRHWISRGLAATVACCVTVLSCPTVDSKSSVPVKKTTPRAKKATTDNLGGPNRYLTFISTDKPMYRSGEKVYVRGTLLNAANHKPLIEGTGATIAIKGPKGDVVSGGEAYVSDSVWSFAWEVPEGQAGGEYTVQATYPWTGHAPAERKFDIRTYRAPRLKSQITFLRDGYGPGERVSATLDVKRAEGGAPEGARVTVTANIDGVDIKGAPAKVDARGFCKVSLDLPRQISRGEGTLALIIEDGGVVETASKTIPILLQTVDVQMYPEGGELLSGCPNRVYIQATQPNGKPADLVAKLVAKSKSETMAVFRTMHEGRGRFEFTPNANEKYYLAIAQPSGIKTIYWLPAAKKEGAVIHADKDVFGKNEPITLHVGCSDHSCRVTLSKREVELASTKLEGGFIGPGVLRPLTFNPPANIDGVLTLTVWDNSGLPMAERLIFRQPANPLKISVRAAKKSYVPGDRPVLTIKATDSNDKPVSAVVGVTVTDDSVLEMVDKREQAPHLPVMVYLEPEVKDLADAHVYLDPSNPKAPMATDLLLGTQGWRRFGLMGVAKFIEKHGDQARRVVALKIQSQLEVDKASRLAALPPPPMAMAMEEAPAPLPQRAIAKPQAAFLARPVPMPVARAFGQAEQELKPGRALMAKDDANAPAVASAVGGKLLQNFKVAKEKEEVAAGFAGGASANELQGAMRRQAREAKKLQIIDGDELASTRNDLLVVREYAHQVRPNRKPTDRTDFTETLYWNAGVRTNAKTGEATIAFGLNDSVSTFRVFADGFSNTGSVGATNIGIESVQPFYAEAKMPLEVTTGDHILLPISLVNATENKLQNADLKIGLKGDFKLADLKDPATLGAGSRTRIIQPINVGVGNGPKDFQLTAKAGGFEDHVTRKLSVKPKGFPTEVAFGGMLEPGKTITHDIMIPKNVVPRSLTSNTAVYPTPLANLTEALQRLIQDPNGCFEQTSSTSYPLTMAQQYFVSHTGVDPKLVETSRKKLDDGYKKLVGFWCPDKGYEWFGENPGHEALTAFGVLHFSDMSKVRDVDEKMVTTTRAWLMKQKDGKGGFTRKRRALHTWIEDKDCSNAYIVWALLESGQDPAELKEELEALKKAAAASHNNYVVALAANALHLAGQKAEAAKLMERLGAKQKADGSMDSVTASIVGSEGESLAIEGTSLATLAWMREPAFAGRVEKSIKYLADCCQDGRYGSTQATVLALRAIVTYDKLRAHPKASGKVRLYVDGQSIGDWADFDKSTEGAIKLPDMTELLTPGNHKLELRMQDGAAMPYSLAVKYNALTPASSKDCKVEMKVKLAQEKLIEGSATEANVTVINKTKNVIPTPIAIVGLPGGLEPRHDQLKELVKRHVIDAYEVNGREVVFYWRTLPGDAKVVVPLSLIAAIPGTYTGPASRCYLYYTDEHKNWTDGVHVEIAAK